MSRKVLKITEHITVINGLDHAIGNFIDIQDSRFANSYLDKQGEGYVFEYSDKFEISTNLVGLKYEDLKSKEIIIERCNQFINILNQSN